MMQKILTSSNLGRDRNGRAFTSNNRFSVAQPLSDNDAMRNMIFFLIGSGRKIGDVSRCAIGWGLKLSNPWKSRSRE